MNSRLVLFVKRWWYPLTLFPWFAAFMTPGLTMLAFIGFIFFSGIAVRPKLEQLIDYATGSTNDEFDSKAISNMKRTRKRTSVRRTEG